MPWAIPPWLALVKFLGLTAKEHEKHDNDKQWCRWRRQQRRQQRQWQWWIIDAQLWAVYQADIQDGGLDWDFSDPGNQVVFMDLTISIVADRIRTTLFEKDLALYQYTHPPPGLLNGFVIGQALHFHQLCTLILDVNDKMRLLHKRLMQRGYSEEKLFPYFLQGLRQQQRWRSQCWCPRGWHRRWDDNDAMATRTNGRQQFNDDGRPATCRTLASAAPPIRVNNQLISTV